MNGRNVIYTDVTDIHAGNIKDVVEKAMTEHEFNRGEADYLYQYYKGNQPILERTKDVRPEICNKIVINVANEIVSFKTGYLCGEPVQYVNRTTDEEKSKSIKAFLIYAAVGIVGFGLTELGMWLGVKIVGSAGLWYVLVKCFVAGVVLIWNYVGRKVFVYREK